MAQSAKLSPRWHRDWPAAVRPPLPCRAHVAAWAWKRNGPAEAGPLGNPGRLAAGTRGSVVALGHVVDRKSTRLNSSHLVISYAVFCLKKKKHNYDRNADI